MIFLSSLLQILSYPPFPFWFLSWFSLAPWFLFLSKAGSARRAFWNSYLCGFLFWVGTIYWVGYVTILGTTVLILYLGLFWAVFGLFFFWLWKRKIRNWIFLFSISAMWSLLEWIRAHLFGGFGWNLFAYSQAPNLAFIQIADTIGAFGVSFLLVWINGAIFLGQRSMVNGQRKGGRICSSFDLRPFTFDLPIHLSPLTFLLTLVLIAVVYSYGFFRLTQETPSESISVSILQGNIPQAIKWDPEYGERIFKTYETLSRAVQKERPSLIIWPETSVPEDLTKPEVQTRIASLAKSIETPLLVGAFVSSRKEENGRWKVESGKWKAGNGESEMGSPYYNSAALFLADGTIATRYNKLHLVPFGEFIPFERQLPVLRDWIITGNFISGKEYVTFNLPIPPTTYHLPHTISFAALICFEDIFPDQVRRFVQKGADFLVNITNDAWFGQSGAPYQHTQASIFRAVENRVPIVRSTNTGFSCFIDEKGRVHEEIPDLFSTSHKTALVDIPLRKR